MENPGVTRETWWVVTGYRPEGYPWYEFTIANSFFVLKIGTMHCSCSLRGAVGITQ